MSTFHPELIKVERIQEGHREYAAHQRLVRQARTPAHGEPRASLRAILRSAARRTIISQQKARARTDHC